MRLQVQWRQWLTQRLIGRWLSDRRFYQLSIAGDPAKNPEYRIADDIRMATEPGAPRHGTGGRRNSIARLKAALGSR
jgi:ABC-type uncharacterized transport system fused permease/ATPase subunit